MNRDLAPRPLRAATVVVLSTLAGCSWFGNSPKSQGDSIDYRTSVKQSAQLEVPPDLTQLAREGRYQQRSGGAVSASELAAQAASAPAPAQATSLPAATPGQTTPASVAPNAIGDLHLAREGQTRWLVTTQSPEQVWPAVQAFWRDLGFTLTVDDAQAGVMETSWAENRAMLPDDIVRRTLGNVLSALFSTGLRDRFRTRVERGPDGTDIYIAHRGAEEVLVGQLRDQTTWQPRPSDPQLEAEMLSRLMLRLGGASEQAKAAKADAPKAPPSGPRELVLPERAELEIDEGFDRAWRRVGLALDRSGFTVEDRDRSAGLYFVRYYDPRQVDRDEPNFFTKLFSSSSSTSGLAHYRVAIKADANVSLVTVLDSQGGPEKGEAGQRILALLLTDLK